MEDVKNILTPQEELNIVELAEAERRKLDLGRGPLGEKIFSVLRDINVQLLYFISKPKEDNALAAFYLKKFSSVTNMNSYYIAINTSMPLDLQVFNASHEYYHHIDEVEQNLHIHRLKDPDDEIINAKANRFAAEFLLSTESLNKFVKKHNRGEINLNTWELISLLRLVAQLQIDFQVPYRMIVKRLYEIKAVDSNNKEKLLSIDERDEESLYYRIGKTINENTFDKLNTPSSKVGIEPETLNVILQNYDESMITVDTAVRDMELFGKTLQDFGYSIEVLDEDIDELIDLFGDDGDE